MHGRHCLACYTIVIPFLFKEVHDDVDITNYKQYLQIRGISLGSDKATRDLIVHSTFFCQCTPQDCKELAAARIFICVECNEAGLWSHKEKRPASLIGQDLKVILNQHQHWRLKARSIVKASSPPRKQLASPAKFDLDVSQATSSHQPPNLSPPEWIKLLRTYSPAAQFGSPNSGDNFIAAFDELNSPSITELIDSMQTNEDQ